ncbi:tRNA-specific adenosine deaminase [Candidatus Epulonipiscium fishelsonii]|uniref:tRNA-specific adenosine deaminase n=1 Tax=Candidatus Epulonipiscium fishelsonii TaxID=77094 RepID=A0ACC8XGI4_9FIRM|nr:tRNA-specific adenosine deaminase [Epulopiscium sp. SCG-B05WGA-EpuloA1]ONI42686.1 tRNA-specific adenosine deaminase [Epulopiscium sp. SCG-B11WGA-EpuloA1]ONI47797.1 tRNA-specific adenosine deaminase [Epulopiscium sp. SCG-C06WGA-EpuloA1]
MHEIFMMEALRQADIALSLDEIPIGAIITHKNKIIGKACNQRNTYKNSLYHAEILAINQACETIGDWRLEECTIYITLEPCPMCAGAIIQSRIPTVVYGASSPKSGCAGSILNILEMDALNHKCEVIRGIKEEECTKKLTNYFQQLRLKK